MSIWIAVPQFSMAFNRFIKMAQITTHDHKTFTISISCFLTLEV